jgi:phenylpropionate dioxygenase-like ring-hydroxylating dioxygenase large terminal subunit
MTEITEQPVVIRGTPRDKAPEPALSDAPITGDRYWSPDFAARECEALWSRVWQVAGRVDQIPEAGDYLTYEIGRDSILAVRGSDGVVRAFYNVCQHRGNRLVSAESGSLAGGEFQCAYHGWRFGDDGRLNWV